MSQYYRVCYVKITASEEQRIAAELSYPSFLKTLKQYNMGKVEGYGWPITDPIIRVLIKGVFPPGRREINKNGDYVYETSMRLWHEQYTHGQDYVLDFLASIGAEMQVETITHDRLYRSGSTKKGSFSIVYENVKELTI